MIWSFLFSIFIGSKINLIGIVLLYFGNFNFVINRNYIILYILSLYLVVFGIFLFFIASVDDGYYLNVNVFNSIKYILVGFCFIYFSFLKTSNKCNTNFLYLILFILCSQLLEFVYPSIRGLYLHIIDPGYLKYSAHRYGGILFNPNWSARYVSLLLIVALYFAKSRKEISIIFLISFISIALTQSRTGFLFLVVFYFIHLFSIRSFSILASLIILFFYFDHGNMSRFYDGSLSFSFIEKFSVVIDLLRYSKTHEILFGHFLFDDYARGFLHRQSFFDSDVVHMFYTFGALFTLLFWSTLFYLSLSNKLSMTLFLWVVIYSFSSSVFYNVWISPLVIYLFYYLRHGVYEKRH